MHQYTPSGVARSAALLALALSFQVAAQDDICRLIVDPIGDVGDPLTLGNGGTDQFPMVDIEWVGMADDGDNYEFYIKVASLAQVPPQTGWTVIFDGPDGVNYTAAMLTDAAANTSFVYYPSAAIDEDPALWSERLTPGIASGDFTSEGLIRIAVPAADVGAAANKTVSGLVSRIRAGQNPALSPTPENAPNDLEPVGRYTLGGGCAGKSTTTEAFMAGTGFSEKACAVVTDASGDTTFPQHDLIGVGLSAAGNTMVVSWNFTDNAAPTADTLYGMHWLDKNDNGRFVAFYIQAGSGVANFANGQSGSWDPDSNSYTSENSYLNADGWVKTSSQTALILEVPLADIGNPGTLNSVGSLVVQANSGQIFEQTENSGTFAVGSSTCSKGIDAEKSAAASPAGVAGAGSAGWLLIVAGLLGLHRRSRRA